MQFLVQILSYQMSSEAYPVYFCRIQRNLVAMKKTRDRREILRRNALESVTRNSKRTILGELSSKNDEADFVPKSQTSKEIMSVPMVDKNTLVSILELAMPQALAAKKKNGQFSTASSH